MLRSFRGLRTPLLLVVLAAPVAACELVNAKSAVAEGQLFAPGDTVFDAYFHKVHNEHQAVKGWEADRKAARAPLAQHLAMSETARDTAIFDSVQATIETLGGPGMHLEISGLDVKATPVASTRPDPGFSKAIEETTRLELQRVKKLVGRARRLEDLAAEGHDLEPIVRERFRAQGFDKQREVRSELRAAQELMRHDATVARRAEKEVEEFTHDLARALAVGGSASALASTSAAPGDAGPAKAAKTAAGDRGTPPQPSQTATAAPPKSSAKTAEPLPPPKPPPTAGTGQVEEDFKP